MTALSIDVTDRDVTHGWEAVQPTHRYPSYLASAKGDVIAAEEIYLRICSELENCQDEQEAEGIRTRIQDAAKTCDMADGRYREAYARFNNEERERLGGLNSVFHASTIQEAEEG